MFNIRASRAIKIYKQNAPWNSQPDAAPGSVIVSLSSSVHSIKMSQSLKLKRFHTFSASGGYNSTESSVPGCQTKQLRLWKFPLLKASRASQKVSGFME